MRLVALPGLLGGRDGHSYVPLFQAASGFHALPLKLHQFRDGWFVVAAQEPYQGLVGKRLVQVGDAPVRQVAALLSPLVSRDNDTTVKARLGNFLVVPELLRAKNLTDRVDAVSLVVEDGIRGRLDASVKPVTGRDYEAWQNSFDTPENFGFDYLAGSGTLLVHYNAVRAETAGGESMQQFSERVRTFVDGHRVGRVVVDLRRNGGGNNTTYRPLFDLLTQNEAVNRPGRLFVLIGRDTFSAAGNFAAELEQAAHVLFVGEPTGGGVNQYGDSVPVKLPHSGLEARIASRYWQMSSAADERLTLTPNIPVDVTSADFFAHRDLALETLLAHP